MAVNGTIKAGIATTLTGAALTAGAIAGAVIVGGMGMAAASTALIVASVVLGIFTLLSATTLIRGPKNENVKEEDTQRACYFFKEIAITFSNLLGCVGSTFKKCCCCKKESNSGFNIDNIILNENDVNDSDFEN